MIFMCASDTELGRRQPYAYLTEVTKLRYFSCNILYSRLLVVFFFNMMKDIFAARKRSLRQGNVFTPVCQSFCSGGVSAPLHDGIHPLGRPPPLWILRDMDNKRTVRVLLECILFAD